MLIGALEKGTGCALTYGSTESSMILESVPASNGMFSELTK